MNRLKYFDVIYRTEHDGLPDLELYVNIFQEYEIIIVTWARNWVNVLRELDCDVNVDHLTWIYFKDGWSVPMGDIGFTLTQEEREFAQGLL